MKFIILHVLFLFLSLQAFGHNDSHKKVNIKAPKESTVEKPKALGSSSMELLEKALGLTKDHGKGRFFNTENSDVQRLVNQGFAMLNMFQYTDAFRSFNEALSKDPKSVESYIGRAFASVNLDGRNSYFPLITINFLIENEKDLTKKQRAWANLLLSKLTGKNLANNDLTTQAAYKKLTNVDQKNLEVRVFANWVSGTYDIPTFKQALKDYPENAGAAHYLLHLAEMENDHDNSLKYGEILYPLALGSGHAQHMYGHALPHFNRWNEADKFFQISHDIHMKWAKKNDVSPFEDWHYEHNLDLWSVTNMVLNPGKAVLVLEELQQSNPRYILDLLDLYVAVDLKQANKKITSFEQKNDKFKKYVLSSRILYELVKNSSSFTENKNQWKIQIKSVISKNKALLLSNLIELIEAAEANNTKKKQSVITALISTLKQEFSKGGFDGWRKSVLETLVLKRVFEAYDLKSAEQDLNQQIIKEYMTPID